MLGFPLWGTIFTRKCMSTKSVQQGLLSTSGKKIYLKKKLRPNLFFLSY